MTSRIVETSARAAQVRAIDGKNLELLSFDAPHPARCVHGLAVGWGHVGIGDVASRVSPSEIR